MHAVLGVVYAPTFSRPRSIVAKMIQVFGRGVKGSKKRLIHTAVFVNFSLILAEIEALGLTKLTNRAIMLGSAVMARTRPFKNSSAPARGLYDTQILRPSHKEGENGLPGLPGNRGARESHDGSRLNISFNGATKIGSVLPVFTSPPGARDDAYTLACASYYS